ncbi:NUMOD4 domain-containing protein [Gracilimonas sp.]|uniref:NUMOD4 domain-containing protein n=1 Tax=Gracilimonas sp. TaxID=1974203 RepID=UPI00287170AE|nr:NUMOD4 domain-containing protein [Gracilimonas sp.]
MPQSQGRAFLLEVNMELWKDIDGYDGYYQISNKGRVRTWKNGRWGRRDKPNIMRLHVNRYGYLEIRLQKENVKSLHRIHRLVAKNFVENPDNKPHVNHKDCDKLNNYPENLEWVTNTENVKHAVKNGLNVKGEASHFARLTKNDVLQIRSILSQGFATNTEIAEAYNISMPTVSNIKNRDSWRHL